jgi:hypothetical protein
MRALVHAPHVPTRLVGALVALSGAAVVLAIAAGVLVGALGAFWFLTLAMAFGALALARPFWFRTRELTVDTEPGRVHLRRPIGGVTIDRRDVVGATTCLYQGRVATSLTVSVWRGTTTVTLAFEDEASAERIRAALGLPRDGAGETSFAVSPSTFDTATRTLAGFVACAALLAFLTPRDAHQPEIYGLFTFFYGGPALVLALVLAAIGHTPASRRRRIALRPEAAYLPGEVGAVAVPYERIVGAVPHVSGLEVRLEGAQTAYLPVRVPYQELELAAAQLTSAAQRARGEGQKTDEPGERIARLARSEGESVQAWMTRLDGTAASLGGGYRGADLSFVDLERAANDIDLSTDLRLAAARVLRKAQGATGPRVDTAALPSSSAAHAALFRIADGPIDEVARAYDALDETTDTEARRGHA